ncbi:MAG TPA: DUF6159 family protein [Verrucomicrobiae bacterium]|nr:DUF6159 family protein [Verrucomicrobiae bacterium]
MNSFERSRLLLNASLRVIFQNKKLLIFPLIISVLTLGIIAFFLAPVALQPTGYSYTQPEHWEKVGSGLFEKTETGRVTIGDHNSPSRSAKVEWHISREAAVYGVFLYLLAMYLATFFNVAFYHEILAALKGESVSIVRGLFFACGRWHAILLWSLFAGLVGVAIRLIEERLGIIGRIIAGILGTVWSVASLLVVPAIAYDSEAINPFRLLRESANSLRHTWGRNADRLRGFVFRKPDRPAAFNNPDDRRRGGVVLVAEFLDYCRGWRSLDRSAVLLGLPDQCCQSGL